MQVLKQIKKKSSLLLIAGIFIVSIGFIIISCGKKPTLKTANPYQGAYALDNTDCPDLGNCTASFTSLALNELRRNIAGKEITMEGWIKPKLTSAFSRVVYQRSDTVNGVFLSVAPSSSLTVVTPTFTIRRAKATTGTDEYTVTSTIDVALNTWAHIAGILVNDDHTVDDPNDDDVIHAACAGAEAGAESQTPHLDIYVDGVFAGCASTASGYASNPPGLALAVGNFLGIVDEFRLWTVSRLMSGALPCMNTELGYSSDTCGRLHDSLISYMRFNEGSGHNVGDFTGLGSAGKEYPDPDLAGEFLDWETGWTSDVPDDGADITPAD